MTDEMFEKQVMKKIRFMTNYIWDGINFNDVERFLLNFGEDRIVGLVLLDMLIYYSYEQEEYLVDNLIRLLIHDLWISEKVAEENLDSVKINERMQNIYKQICFVPVKSQDPTDSAYSISALYKKVESLPDEVEFIEVKDIPLMISIKKKYFVFYDDIIGTGNQFDVFWSNKHYFGDKEITIKDVAEKNPDIKFIYLVFSGYEESIKNLQNKYSELKIIASEVFTSDYSVFDDNNEYWEFNMEKKEIVQKYVEKVQRDLKVTSKFSLNLPVLFQHSRASNTSLSLFWYSQEDVWKELYRM